MFININKMNNFENTLFKAPARSFLLLKIGWLVLLSVCLQPKINATSMRPGWRKVVVQWTTNS